MLVIEIFVLRLLIPFVATSLLLFLRGTIRLLLTAHSQGLLLQVLHRLLELIDLGLDLHLPIVEVLRVSGRLVHLANIGVF